MAKWTLSLFKSKLAVPAPTAEALNTQHRQSLDAININFREKLDTKKDELIMGSHNDRIFSTKAAFRRLFCNTSNMRKITEDKHAEIARIQANISRCQTSPAFPKQELTTELQTYQTTLKEINNILEALKAVNPIITTQRNRYEIFQTETSNTRKIFNRYEEELNALKTTIEADCSRTTTPRSSTS